MIQLSEWTGPSVLEFTDAGETSMMRSRAVGESSVKFMALLVIGGMLQVGMKDIWYVFREFCVEGSPHSTKSCLMIW